MLYVRKKENTNKDTRSKCCEWFYLFDFGLLFSLTTDYREPLRVVKIE